MPDLRSLPKALAAHGDIVTPPLDAVARRARRSRVRRTTRNAALVLVVVLLAPTVAEWVTDGDESSHVRLVDRTTTTTLPADAMALGSPALGPVLPKPAPTTSVGAAATPTTTTTTTGPPPVALSCRPGENGGRTAPGVTSEKIKLVMTETLEFPTRYATVDAARPVRALFDEVNFRGGICGRFIDFRLANEIWGPLPWEPGADVLAGIAGPLDPAIDEKADNGTIDSLGVPLVVASGGIGAHRRSPWMWPTGLSTASFTRIAVEHARSLSAQSFALVFDAGSPVGQEARTAFDQFVGSDASVKHMQSVHASSDFEQEALRFNTACGVATCDFVVLAMPAPMALEWLKALPTVSRLPATLLPAQLSRHFWDQCADVLTVARCGHLRVWADDVWPPGLFASSRYSACRELRAVAEGAAALVSACALVEALQEVGPNVTRSRLRDAMEHVTLRNGMVVPMHNGERGHPEREARQLKPVYGVAQSPDDPTRYGVAFGGLVDAGSGYRRDPKSE